MYDCAAPEVQAVWVSCTALSPLGTVAQLPLAWLTIVLVKVVAAPAGATTAKPATREATASRTGRLIAFLRSQDRKEPYGPLKIAVFWLWLKCVFG